MLAKLAHLSMDEWWCALAWLALGFLAMAKLTTSLLIQTMFTLTALPFLLHLLTSTWTFISYLDCQAPSHCRFLRKLSRIKHAPKQKKAVNIAIIFRIKTNLKRKNLPQKTHLLASSKQVDCWVDQALHVSTSKTVQLFLSSSPQLVMWGRK